MPGLTRHPAALLFSRTALKTRHWVPALRPERLIDLCAFEHKHHVNLCPYSNSISIALNKNLEEWQNQDQIHSSVNRKTGGWHLPRRGRIRKQNTIRAL